MAMRSIPLEVYGVLALGFAVSSTYLPAPKRTEVPVFQVDAGAPVRVGLVFDVGGRGDKSFNDAAYRGLERARRELGVEVSYLEPAGSEDREAALRLFAARGFDVVLGVGFIFSSDVDAVARAYPNSRFACVDYAPSGEIPTNVAGLSFREEEGAFVVGAAAGLLSKTRHVGFVGGMQSPLIRKFEAGYAAGVRASCPTCVVHGGYAGTTPDAFRDPAKGKSLAISQITAGADVLFHASGATGQGMFEAAKDARVLAIGTDADQYNEMPGTVVTSMIKLTDVVVFEVIRDVVRGVFRGGMHHYGLAEGALDWVREGPHGAGISPEVREKVEGLKDQVASRKIRVPAE